MINFMLDSARAPAEAPPYRVLCFVEDPDAPDGHDHVTAIETHDPDGGTTRWRSVDVIAAIHDGDRFVIGQDDGADESTLEPGVCPGCAMVTLTSDPPGRRPSAC